jgi:GLPGLI family protein
MMKRFVFSGAALLLLALTAKAQKPDTARVLVHYKFTWLRDTTNRANPYTENMVLYVGKSAGAYRSYDGIEYNAQFKKAYVEAAANSPDGNVRISRRAVGTPVEYYQFPDEQKLVTTDQLLFNRYLIEAPMPAIVWKISGDTATFGGLHCQKATCHFKGRVYTAWFCPDLPVHVGPRQLNGLPGVIIDARDAKNEVIFKFDGIEKAPPAPAKNETAVVEKDQAPILRGLDDDLNLIAPPAEAIKTTQKEFDKIKETMTKDPRAFAPAVPMGNGTGDGVKTGGVMVPKGAPPRGPVINNPIELPENK